MDFLPKWKTNVGIIVTVLGSLGVATWFGGTDGLTQAVDGVITAIGVAIVVYGRVMALVRK